MFLIKEEHTPIYRFSLNDRTGAEIVRARLIIIQNDLHHQSYGLLEDVFVSELYRGSGYGKKIVLAIIEKARECGCYKLIATSRFEREKVHGLYRKLGFTKYGIEFRINLM